MKEGAGGSSDGVSEVERLRAEVEQLHNLCAETREELMSHREALSQCLELRDGVQAVLSSAQLITEIGDRTAELDLSLAGVSDNTARHGKAISMISEQQKRTTATLDAVVRAVKRLDRSRSRSRCSSVPPGAISGTLRVDYARNLQSGDLPLPDSARCYKASAELPRPGASPRVTEAGTAQWGFGPDGREGECRPVDTEMRPEDSHGQGFPPEDAGEWEDGYAERESAGYNHHAADPWDYPGWHPEFGDQDALPHDEQMRYCSSSSCGSEGRPWRAGGASSRRHQPGGGGSRQRGYSGRSGTGIPDPSLAGPGPGLHAEYAGEQVDRNPSARSGSQRPGSRGTSGNAEMASCVKGVLARIEEALTKLDSGPRDACTSQGDLAGENPGHQHTVPTWDPVAIPSATRSGGTRWGTGPTSTVRPGAAGVRTPRRPQSSAGARNVTPRTGQPQVNAAATPRRHAT